jgi:CBS domain-containing protein
MKAKDVMTHCVVTIAPEATVVEAIGRMLSHQVSGMPVVDAAGRLVGIVSEGDFVRRAELHTEAPQRRWLELLLGSYAGADDYARSHGRTVADVMSPEVATVGPESPLADVVALMDERDVKRVPVVDGGRLVGIVSRADLMVALAKSLGATKHAPASDEAIRDALLKEMKRQTWCPLHAIRVTVRGGVVDMRGEIFDERQRRALRVLVESRDGVRAVHDRLTLAGSRAVAEDDVAPTTSRRATPR